MDKFCLGATSACCIHGMHPGPPISDLFGDHLGISNAFALFLVNKLICKSPHISRVGGIGVYIDPCIKVSFCFQTILAMLLTV